MQSKHRGKNQQRSSQKFPSLPHSPRPKTPEDAECKSLVCPFLLSWHPRPQGGYEFPTQNITKEQLPLVMEEYLGDIDDRDWKMLRNRLMDLAGDAIFVYSTLQAAHHHRGMWGPQEWPHSVY